LSDDLIERIISDPKLNADPLVDEAHHQVSKAGFKYLVTEIVCWTTGGPQQILVVRCTIFIHTSTSPLKSETPF